MVIEVNFTSTEANRHSQIDGVVLEAIGLFEDKKCTRVVNEKIRKLEEIEIILLDYLEQTTNLRETFKQARMSYNRKKSGLGGIIHEALADLGRSRLNKTFQNLIRILDKKVIHLKSRNPKKFVFYIPCRLELNLSENEKRKLKTLVRKTFNLELSERLPKNLAQKIKDSEMLKLFNKRRLLIKISSHARDSQFLLENIVNKEVDGFIGAIAYANHYGKSTHRWSIDSEVSIADIPLEFPTIFIIVEDGKIVYPSSKSHVTTLDYQINDKNLVTPMGKQHWIIHNRPYQGNFDFLIQLIKKIGGQSEKLREITKHCLKIYMGAIGEKEVNMSFLKFWIIGEKILRSNGMVADEKMTNILKKLTGNRYTKQRIEQLQKMRNDLVHEFKIDEISQSDRNLSKSLSENIMMIYLNPVAKFANLQEFYFILENMFLGKPALKRKISILKRLNQQVQEQ